MMRDGASKQASEGGREEEEEGEWNQTNKHVCLSVIQLFCP